jgi:hypothetical protein
MRRGEGRGEKGEMSNENIHNWGVLRRMFE